MKLNFNNSISFFSALIFTLIFISSHQIAKADPFDIFFEPATYTNGSQTQIFPINCGDNIVLPSGGTLTFVVYSYSLSISNYMILSTGPLPQGANFPTAFGATYVQSTFTWTPTGSFFGNIIFQLRGTATVDCTVSFDWPLPVELTSFTYFIYENNVTLNWQTNSETNNSVFIIERTKATNGNNKDWSQAGSVQGNGTSSSSSDYTFTDRDLNSGIYQYRLKQIDYNGDYEYHYLRNTVLIGLPEKFKLYQNYPNPFNPITFITYNIPKEGEVTIIVYDINGSEVYTLVNEFEEAGYYKVEFNGSNLASGIYYYKLESGNFVGTKKMVMLK